MPGLSTRRPSPRDKLRTVEVLIGERAALTLLPSTRRVRVGLPLPGLDRSVDVTVQPATAVRALSEAASTSRVDELCAETTAKEALSRAAETAGAWLPANEATLLGWFGGVAFPLLGAAYDVGATPLTEVPRWAEPVLAASTFGDAASVAFSDRATRPVKRALVDALRPLPSGDISLGVLALGLMGRTALQPDRIARVLGCERVLHPVSDLPDPAVLNSACRVLNHWGDSLTERVLTEAASRTDGLKLLLTIVGYALQLGDHGPTGRLPNQLAELHDAYRILVPTAADLMAQQAVQAGRGDQSRQGACRGRADRQPILPALRANGNLTPNRRIHVPDTYRKLDGTTVGNLTFVLPRTLGDLTRWGRILRNCLGDYGSSVVSGDSVIVGVTRNERLTYAVEITRHGNVRQFNGLANRRPAPRDRQTVLATLVRVGAINPRSAGNRE